MAWLRLTKKWKRKWKLLYHLGVWVVSTAMGKKMETAIQYRGLGSKSMQKKMEACILCKGDGLGFQVEGQGNLVSRLMMGTFWVTIWASSLLTQVPLTRDPK